VGGEAHFGDMLLHVPEMMRRAGGQNQGVWQRGGGMTVISGLVHLVNWHRNCNGHKCNS
jgi:hypothetical protein